MTKNPKKILAEVAGILNTLEIPYIVTGGIAVAVWGHPRFTADLDFVVEIPEDKVEKLASSLRNLSDSVYIDEDSIRKATQNKGSFNVIDAESGLRIDFFTMQYDEFDKVRMGRAVERGVAGESVRFTSPEDLILIKLKWYLDSESSRQIDDIKSVIDSSGKELDRDYLKKWSSEFGGLEVLGGIMEIES